jgi:hypothetical protein
MFISCSTFLASFTVPHEIGNGPASLLWLLPLLAAVAIVWKTLKLQTITAAGFIREVFILFGTILLFIALIAGALYTFGRLIVG